MKIKVGDYTSRGRLANILMKAGYVISSVKEARPSLISLDAYNEFIIVEGLKSIYVSPEDKNILIAALLDSGYKISLATHTTKRLFKKPLIEEMIIVEDDRFDKITEEAKNLVIALNNSGVTIDKECLEKIKKELGVVK